MADQGFQDRMKAYHDAFHRDESEKHFENEIEKYLISPEGGTTENAGFGEVVNFK